MGPLGRALSAFSSPLSFVHSPERHHLRSEVSHRHVAFVRINAIDIVFPWRSFQISFQRRRFL